MIQDTRNDLTSIYFWHTSDHCLFSIFCNVPECMSAPFYILFRVSIWNMNGPRWIVQPLIWNMNSSKLLAHQSDLTSTLLNLTSRYTPKIFSKYRPGILLLKIVYEMSNLTIKNLRLVAERRKIASQILRSLSPPQDLRNLYPSQFLENPFPSQDLKIFTHPKT